MVNISKDYKDELSKEELENIFRYSSKRTTLYSEPTDYGWETIYLFTYTNGIKYTVEMLNGEVVATK